MDIIYNRPTLTGRAIHLYIYNLYTVDPRYIDFDYLEKPLISKRKSGPCFNTEI